MIECTHRKYEFKTEHAFTNLLDTIKKYLNNDGEAFGVFLDEQKAFEIVDHKISIKKLKHYTINCKWNDSFQYFLANGQKYVLLKDVLS